MNTCSVAHHIAKAQPFTLYRQPRVALGLKQLAFVTICGAFEDAMGRSGSSANPILRRQQAARALHWLRDQETTNAFSLRWCSEILGLDSHLLAYDGVARVHDSGLRHWRQWRDRRQGNRIQLRPMRKVECPECGEVFTTRLPKQQFCNATCACAHYAHDRAAEQEQMLCAL